VEVTVTEQTTRTRPLFFSSNGHVADDQTRDCQGRAVNCPSNRDHQNQFNPFDGHRALETMQENFIDALNEVQRKGMSEELSEARD
jgi:hypothetical protein